MNWIGWNPYRDFMQRIWTTNPTRAALEQNNMQVFTPAKASIPFTNNPGRASSTFVRQIRYLPQSQAAIVTLNNNPYTYALTPRLLAQWLNSNSLGRFYNNHIKLK